MDKAIKLVGSLIAETGSDEGIIEQLHRKLSAAPNDELAALSAQGCTGCKLCGRAWPRMSTIPAFETY
jgi:hypothetical protein